MSNRIKELREVTGLSETQISSLLNISSYKYKRLENGSLNLTADVLVLLSIMYGVPIDFLIFDRYDTDNFSLNYLIEKIENRPEIEVISILASNMCQYCTFECSSVNYRVVKNILSRTIKSFSENLYNLRCKKSLELFDICSKLQIDIKHYVTLEEGKVWPTLYELENLALIYSKPIDEILTVKKRSEK